MALISPDYKSEQATKFYNNEPGGAKNATQLPPADYYGRVRIFRGYYKNTTGSTIATGKYISLAKIPAGRILPQSKIYYTAFGASATLDLGINQYKDNANGTLIAQADQSIKAALSVASAGSYEIGADNIQGINTNGQFEVLAKTGGAVMPVNAEISALFFVVVD